MESPIPDSYWVAPRLLAGAYPGATEEDEARRRLARFRDAGVTFFLDLTEPSEPGLIPYEALLDSGLRVLRKPVRDFTRPTDEQMEEILDLIDAEIDRGSVVYVHCYGGRGRTGTVVGCWLARHGASGEEALARIAELRGDDRPSPETEAQKEMVLRWARGQEPVLGTDFAARGREVFPGFVGIDVVQAGGGTARAELEIRPHHLAPNGYLHAGVVITLADSACGYGCFHSLPEGATNFATVEVKTNFLGTAREGRLTCAAKRVHGGRTTEVWDATVRDGNGRAIALFRCTQLLIR
jgi:1,4-dihydroxy-2-naphthoyl-CoA hydrolase